MSWRQREYTLSQWLGNCRATECRTTSLGFTSRSSMSGAPSSLKCLYRPGTFEGWRGLPWLPDRMGCRNLQGLRAGLCLRGARPRSMIFWSEITSQYQSPAEPFREIL
jgi:hypothetical protein